MAPSTLLLTILATSMCLYYFVLRKLFYFERFKFPHVKPIPLLSNTAPFIFQRTSHTEYLQKLHNRFSNAKYFDFYDFITPIFIIRDPDLISTISIKQFNNFCDPRNFVNETLDPIASKNLFDIQGDHWRDMRKAS